MTKLQSLILGLVLVGLLFIAYLLTPILEPFLISALLAYLGNPLIQHLQRWHLPRTLAVVLVFCLTIMVLGLFLVLLVPLIEKQIWVLINKIPLMIQYFQTIGLPKALALLDKWNLSQYVQIDSLKNVAGAHWQQASGYLSGYLSVFWQKLFHSGMAIFTWVINLLLIPVVTFYLLRDWHLLLTDCAALLPRNRAPVIIGLLSQCNEVLGAFFKGQLMVTLSLAALYSLGLSLLGLQLALLIGLIAGLLSIVPYLGFSIGLIAALLAALIQFPDHIHLLYVLLVFLLGNVLEGMVLTPWLVGDKIGLHPVAVIFAILAGGQLFGFIGILLALPVAAVLMVLLRHVHRHYLNSQWMTVK
jgi:predicted PurR-regulated permease PerM